MENYKLHDYLTACCILETITPKDVWHTAASIIKYADFKMEYKEGTFTLTFSGGNYDGKTRTVSYKIIGNSVQGSDLDTCEYVDMAKNVHIPVKERDFIIFEVGENSKNSVWACLYDKNLIKLLLLPRSCRFFQLNTLSDIKIIDGKDLEYTTRFDVSVVDKSCADAAAQVLKTSEGKKFVLSLTEEQVKDLKQK